ncbi:MAG: AMP-binding protein [Acidimicrobiales bacterium]
MAITRPAVTITESPILATLARHASTDRLLVENGHSTTAADALRFADAMNGALRAAGLNESARVCVVMPSGRILALTALAAMSIGGCAPVNPRLHEDEFVSIFTDLDADALVSIEGFAPAARTAARRRGMSVIHATHASVDIVERATKQFSHHPSVHALYLHTSGTTSRPKLVGLTASNLLSSASAVAATLRLSPADRCLGVMPLFHIHGLVGVLLASVVAGASVELVPRYDPFTFRRQLSRPDITWTSAVPSMYRAMLSRGGGGPPTNSRLRLVRSSSAPLPSITWRGLEDTFGCPVVNAYGMTEAAHQMTSNPLPPGERRIGTVGSAAGAEVAVLPDGEVVVRGPGVMREYLSPSSANDSAWRDAWFRTGDLGSLDGSGYLTLHGRIKEIINVGGEKVSPYEVEAVLLDHPSVVDAVAFAAPDRMRGEQVRVIVVARGGVGSVEEIDLRRFVADRLASFKVPRRIITLAEIPVGPTGKVQRARMSALAGLDDEPVN